MALDLMGAAYLLSAAVNGLIGLIVIYRQGKNTDTVNSVKDMGVLTHNLVNSKMQQMQDIIERAAFARGQLQGPEEVAARAPARSDAMKNTK